jgi:hypothetical protein
MTLGQIYTLAEAAERLRTTGNALARLARRTGHCSQIGRDLRFSEADMEALWQELRVPAKAGRSVQRVADLGLGRSKKLEEWLKPKRKHSTRS